VDLVVWHGADDGPGETESSGDGPRGARARDGDGEGGVDGRASIARRSRR